MKRKNQTKRQDSDSRKILDCIRKLVNGLRQSSLVSERRFGLSSAQLYVLNTLASSSVPLSVSELAEQTMTHQSSVSVVVTKLVGRGFVRKRRSTLDSRRAELVITEQGRRLLGRDPDPIQDRLIGAIQSLNPTAREHLASGFEQILSASGLDREKAALFFENTKMENRQSE